MFTAAASTFARLPAQRTARAVSQGTWERLFHSTCLAEAKLNVEGLAEKVNLEGQNVLMRVDLNVPLSKEVSPIFSIID